MFRFQYAPYFWLLLLIPIIILGYLYFLAWRKRNLKKLGEESLIKELIQGKINGRLTTKVVLTSLSVICLVVAVANLQAGGHPEKVERKGLNVIFALDVSNSMLARDVPPDRVSKAKELIYRTLEQLKNDRTGLIAFAGNAYLQVPLTIDYGAMKMLLSSVNPGMIPTQGTNFSGAINLANKSFSKNDKQNKVIILISDGEDHDEDAIDAAKSVAENGIIIYTVGIGSPRGSTIYDPSTGQPKVDRQGNVIITKLNEDELRSIAEATGGKYQLLQNAGQVADNLANSIQQLSTKNLGSVVYTDYKSYFQYFLGAGLILLIIAWFLPEAKKEKRAKSLQKATSGGSTTTVLFLFLGLFLGAITITGKAFAQEQKNEDPVKPTLSFKKTINNGNQEFDKRQYDSAQKAYKDALKQNPKSFEANFNMADALYASGKYEEAKSSLGNSLKSPTTKENKADAYHNIGNSLLKQRKWQKAADAFKQSLLLNPNDKDTKYNLAYAQEMMRQENKKDKKNKDNKNNKDNQQKKDQQKKQGDQDKDQQNQKQDKEKQQPQNQAPMQPSKLTKQQADNILNALDQEEQDLHKKEKAQKGTPVKPEKDW